MSRSLVPIKKLSRTFSILLFALLFSPLEDSRLGNYSPIITETEETNCFSIYTHGKISKSKIENVLLNFLIGTSERDITHELIYNVLKCKIFSNIC